MKIKLVLRDIEYRKALARALARAGGELYVEVGKDFRTEERCLILTDIRKEYPGSGFIYLSADRSLAREEGGGPYILFKYEPVSVLIQKIARCYYLLTGEGAPVETGGKLIAVCCDRNPVLAGNYAGALARELIYRSSGKVLLLSLRYVNPDADKSEQDDLRQLLYTVEKGRNPAIEAFFRRDRYDLYTLPAGGEKNHLAYLGAETAARFLRSISGTFSYIILDIGDCYSEQNLSILALAGYRLLLTENAGQDFLRSFLPDLDAIHIPFGEDWELTIRDQTERIIGKEHRASDGEKKDHR